MIGGNRGLVRSGISAPIEYERLVFRPRAIGSGRYPSSSAARITRSAVSTLTSPRVSSLSARDTVPGCTSARRATSRIVTDDRMATNYAVACGPSGLFYSP